MISQNCHTGCKNVAEKVKNTHILMEKVGFSGNFDIKNQKMVYSDIEGFQ
jgi:hypothetical protein